MAQRGIYRDASIVTARPVVPGPIAEYSQPWALTTGSQINEASEGGPYKASPLASGSSLNVAQKDAPWPGIINGAVKFFNSWKPNALRAVQTHNVAGNYGSVTGTVDFGTRGFEFDGYQSPNGLIAGYPTTGGVNPYVEPWNDLIPIVYGIRVLNPATAGSDGLGGVVPQNQVSQFTTPTQFTPTGTATLASRGVVLR